MDVNVLYDRVVGYETNECEYECERDCLIWLLVILYRYSVMSRALTVIRRLCTHFDTVLCGIGDCWDYIYHVSDVATSLGRF